MTRKKKTSLEKAELALNNSWMLTPEELEEAIASFLEGKDMPELGSVRKGSLHELYERRPTIAKAAAYNEYMLGDSAKEITKRYGIPYNTFMSWVHQGKLAWKPQREKLEQKYVDTLVEEKVEEVGLTMSMMLSLIRSSLVKLTQQANGVEINDIPKLTKAVSDLHRFTRLKQNLATDIVEEVKGKTAIDIMEEIQKEDALFLEQEENE